MFGNTWYSQDRQADHERDDTNRTRLRQVAGVRNRELRADVTQRRDTASAAWSTQCDFWKHRKDLRISQPTLPQGTRKT